jgi:hypothetical protein
MTTSSTYAFAPAASDLVLNAFGRLQIRGPELTAGHLNDAAMEANLLLSQFTNRNPNAWLLETPTIPLVQGTATYSLPNRSVAIAVVYLTTGSGSTAVDRPLGNMSATDYAAIPVKTTQGPPTQVFFSLLPVPTITLWPTPDGNGPYSVNVMSYRQTQDLSLASGQQVDAPFRFLDAFAAGMAYRLSRMYKPELTVIRKAEWEDAWNESAAMDQQNTSIFIVPGLDGYFR